tara:strand:+ start:207 stop:401 length:195 start_codon:yes stop_codon:yes gene_type:complete
LEGVGVNVGLNLGVGEGVFVGGGVGVSLMMTGKATTGVIESQKCLGIGVATFEITDPIKFVGGI